MITKRKLFNNIASYTEERFFFTKSEIKAIIQWIKQVKKRRNSLFIKYRKNLGICTLIKFIVSLIIIGEFLGWQTQHATQFKK